MGLLLAKGWDNEELMGFVVGRKVVSKGLMGFVVGRRRDRRILWSSSYLKVPEVKWLSYAYCNPHFGLLMEK